MTKLKVALPKGHLWDLTQQLFNNAGYDLRQPKGNPNIAISNDPDMDIVIYRAREIAGLVARGDYDLGVTGYDWLLDRQINYVKNGTWQLTGGTGVDIMDFGVGKVDLVVAVPVSYNISEFPHGSYQRREGIYKEVIEAVRSRGRGQVKIASEYENVARRLWRLYGGGFSYNLEGTIGSTENFLKGDPPPADIILDCSETGETIKNAGGIVIDRLFQSTARLVAYRGALDAGAKNEKIQDIRTNLKPNLHPPYTRITMHVPQDRFKAFMEGIPAMRSPTIARLANGDYSIVIAVPKKQVVLVRPSLQRRGAVDILEDTIDRVTTGIE